MRAPLTDVYRTVDDYRRYTSESRQRLREMESFYAAYRGYIGRRVLDLCCGGGVLGQVLEQQRREYIGVDANPDMIREARRAAREAGSKQRFVLGDVARVRITGQFDTLTLIGNSLTHFTAGELDQLLRRRRTNVHAGSTLILDYRDLVGMFAYGAWSKVKVPKLGGGKAVHRVMLIDVEHGRLAMRSRSASRKWVLDWTHAIWSPFIVETLMRSHGWRLVERMPQRSGAAIPEHVYDVYRLAASPG